MTHTEHPSHTALVLGGGGSTGNAWLIGVIAGLFDAGLDLTTADLSVGTSAGATAAAQIAGAPPPELFADILNATLPSRPGGPGPGRPSSSPVANHMETTAAIIAASSDVADMRRKMGAAVLEPLLDELPGRVRLLPVKNGFFGGNIGVTGLLTGEDVSAALDGQPQNDRYLLPDVALSRGRFLDGTTAAQLPRVVEIVPTDGGALVDALRRSAS